MNGGMPPIAVAMQMPSMLCLRSPKFTYPNHARRRLVIDFEERACRGGHHSLKVLEAEEDDNRKDPPCYSTKKDGQDPGTSLAEGFGRHFAKHVHDLGRIPGGPRHLLNHVACRVEGC